MDRDVIGLSVASRALAAGAAEDAGRIEKMQGSVASASAEVRSALFYYGAFGLYFAITVASTTHEGLLRGSLVTMPLFGIGMPAQGFFAFVPLLLIILHMWVWLQLLILAGRLRVLNELQTQDAAARKFQSLLLNPFAVTQWFVGQPPGLFLQSLLWLAGLVVLVIAPLGLLIGTQIRFLPYHSPEITWLHRAYVMIDFLMSAYFCFRLVPSAGGWPARWLRRAPVAVGFLILLLLSGTASGVVATVPDEPLESWLLRLAGDTGRPCQASAAGSGPGWLQSCRLNGRSMLRLTYLVLEAPETPLGLRRNILVRDADLVDAAPPKELLAQGDEGKAWKEAGRGVDLRGRDLRFADLSGSDLSRADLRGADLEGAIVKNAKLLTARIGDIPREELAECLPGLETDDGQKKPFCRTRMAEADLSGSDLRFVEGGKADLQSADLTGANLEGAILEHSWLAGANLEWATLPEAKLRGADLRGATMFGAVAPKAELTCARLEGALLRDTKLEEIGLAGANLTAADLRGSSLDGASFGDQDCNPDESQSFSLHLADLTEILPTHRWPNAARTTNYSAVIEFLTNAVRDPNNPDQPHVFEERSDAKKLLYEVGLAKQLTQLACEADRNAAPSDGQADLKGLRRALSSGIAQRILTEYQHADDQTPGKRDVPVRDAYFIFASVALDDGQCEHGRMGLKHELTGSEIAGLQQLRCVWKEQQGADFESAVDTISENAPKATNGMADELSADHLKAKLDACSDPRR
jgi:uncharacterized protein YjbI with pentapeptide repeats